MLRFGIIGTGSISHKFVSAVRASAGVTVTAVFSRTAESGGVFAAANGISSVYTDMDAFLGSEIDAVYIASPNLCHKEQSLAAIAAGKHVLVEKPAATSEEDFLEMLAYAKARGVVILEAMRPLFTPVLEKARALLPHLGVLRHASFSFRQYSSRYDSFKNGEILNAFNPALGNAALLDIGIYPIATMHALLGVPEVISGASVFLSNGFEGRGTLLCRYGGMTATVDYSKIDGSSFPSFVAGENGILSLDRSNLPKCLTFTPLGGESETLLVDEVENNMVYEISAFRKMTEGTLSPAFYNAETAGVLRVMDQVRKQNGITFSPSPTISLSDLEMKSVLTDGINPPSVGEIVSR